MQRRGFTLIELLVVASVFALTVLLATTVFAGIQRTQRIVQSQNKVTSDGRYVLETIARSVRTGSINYGIYSGGAAGPYETKLSITEADGSLTCYIFDAGNGKVILRTNAAADCSGTDNDLTPSELNIVNLSFFIAPKSDPYRAFPRSASDCATPTTPTTGTPVAGYDTTKGVCLCRQSASGTSADCYSGQRCGSTTNVGQVCGYSGGVSESNCTCQNPNVQPQVTIELDTKTNAASVGEQSEQTLQTTVVSRVYQR